MSQPRPVRGDLDGVAHSIFRTSALVIVLEVGLITRIFDFRQLVTDILLKIKHISLECLEREKQVGKYF